MRHLRTYNESVRDMMKPISDEEIDKKLADMSYPQVAAKLLYAAQDGETKWAEKILDRGMSPNCKTQLGTTPLMFAVMRGHLDLVKLLLKRGANIYAKNNKGETVLDIIRSTPADFEGYNLTPEQKRNFRTYHRELAQVLRSYDVNLDESLRDKMTPIPKDNVISGFKNKTREEKIDAIIRVFISNDIGDVDTLVYAVLEATDADIYTRLNISYEDFWGSKVSLSEDEILGCLTDEELYDVFTYITEINESVRSRMTPRSTEEVERSLSNLSPLDKLKTLKKYKIDNIYSKEEIDEIKEQAVDEFIKGCFSLRGALLKAIEHGEVELAEMIIQRGADVNADREGALRLAAKEEDGAMVMMLIKNGAKPNAAIKHHKDLFGDKYSHVVDEIRYFKDYKPQNESVRDKMTPKSEEDIRLAIKNKLNMDSDHIEVKIPEPKDVKKIKSLLDLSDEYSLDIKDYDDNNIMVCGDIVNVFNFIKFYVNYTMMNKQNKRDFFIKYILDNIVEKVTESLRDRMTPKSKDTIENSLRNLSQEELNDRVVRAVTGNNLETLEHVLPYVDISDDELNLCELSIDLGHMGVLGLLVGKGISSENRNHLLDYVKDRFERGPHRNMYTNIIQKYGKIRE
jgi:hypothetical protein